MKYFISSYSNYVLNNIHWLTGPARSGTSVIGGVFYTLKNVEYFYEPEFLFSLLPTMHKLKADYFELLYSTYLSEELVFNSIVGRKINFRNIDQSYIGNSKTPSEINFKMKNKLNRSAILNFYKKKNFSIVIKVPDLVKNIINLKIKYPKNKIIFINRNSFDLINSLITKNWFDDKNIKNSIFPLTKIKNCFYPVWLPKENYDNWNHYNSAERSVLYVNLIKKIMREYKPDFQIDYDEFIENPKSITEKICYKFKLKQTKKTVETIKRVKKKNKNLKNLRGLNIRQSLINDII